MPQGFFRPNFISCQEKTYFCTNFSPMRKTFKVAEHVFAVDMPDDIEGWNKMQNYEPFVTENSDHCLFVAEQAILPDTSDKEKVTVCCNAPDHPRIDIYEWRNCLLIEVAPIYEFPVCFRMLLEKDFSKMQFQIDEYWQFSFNMIIKLLFAFATAPLFTLQIHSSVTMKDGKGYMFLGKSGTGKSTHSQLWINNIEGCSLLNDDNPVIRICDDGVARVYGSPWSGKTPCYRNLDVPIGAIVNLHQAKENVIKKMSVAEAYASIYASFTGIKFFKELADAYHATNLKLITTVPFYDLDCLPNAEAAYLCYETVSRQ